MESRLHGELEIHHERGVIYFHSTTNGATLLRICGLPPIPYKEGNPCHIDITHLKGVNYITNSITENENLVHAPTQVAKRPSIKKPKIR